ncbi:sulfotransferase [Aliiroseovarius sp. S1339]|uniref:sulfotransferase family protein n=1 Tax=Aliiroseovarius sp. S1339 TaxID=2936990 RepID=UPI0020C16687|nr:sulfotransferase [Aliiroseovarius sp. S1339]MCK8465068.1 sulfotransferase [Aliiroseovarius sp. S1339]
MGLNADWKPPVFIVGASRSGTAMLRSIVMRDESVSLVGETHYFDDLRTRFKDRTISSMSEEERNICADYFRAIASRPYGKQGNPDDSWFTRDELLTYAAELGDSVDCIFEAFCKLRASRDDAQIWGEKTPRHVFRIDDILALYPAAQVVCMVRDPRAVVASYRDWHSGDETVDAGQKLDQQRARKSYHIVLASLMWRAATNAALQARQKHGPDRVKIVLYEDIVNEPEEAVRDVAEWLGLKFSSNLLAVPLHNSSVMKVDHGAGISSTPKNRWRQVLSDREIGVIQHVVGKCLTDVGFDSEDVKVSRLNVAMSYATLPYSVIQAAQANKDRYSSLPKYALRRLRAVLKV